MQNPSSKDLEVEFTRNWWLRCLKDEAKLTAWLQKLQLVEVSGADDWITFIGDFNIGPGKVRTTLENISNDEDKHSKLLIKLMEERGITPMYWRHYNVSTYWESMYKEITDFQTCCAVNYYGEGLAAFRFEVLQSMEETPSDIKEFLRIALPDEIFHRETLKRLAGEEALVKVAQAHTNATAALRNPSGKLV
jgi:hypothetical protein